MRWAKGGSLHGTSPERIGFLRTLLQSTTTQGLEAAEKPYYPNATTKFSILYYFDFQQPTEYEVPLGDQAYTSEVVDPWGMTKTGLPGTFTGKALYCTASASYQAWIRSYIISEVRVQLPLKLD